MSRRPCVPLRPNSCAPAPAKKSKPSSLLFPLSNRLWNLRQSRVEYGSPPPHFQSPCCVVCAELHGTFSEEEFHIMFSLLWTILIGLIVGALAKLFMPGKDPSGIIITILLGIAGSFVAGYLGRLVGWYKEGQPAGFIMSIFGAILL